MAAPTSFPSAHSIPLCNPHSPLTFFPHCISASLCPHKQECALQLTRAQKRNRPLPLEFKRSRKAGGRVQALWTQAPNSPSKQPDGSSPARMELIDKEELFDQALAEAQQRSKPIVIDWMAAWCRKCIYLKPKLEKLAEEFHPDVKFYYVDVNAVPQALVKRAEVTKMPTIQLWKDGKKCDEVIGGHKAWLVVDEVREMLQKH